MWCNYMLITIIVGSVSSMQKDLQKYISRSQIDYENLMKKGGQRHVDYKSSKEAAIKYDYIIVGSGAAGSVLANRLSTNPAINVLLLEAGDVPSLLSEVPFLAPLQQFTRQNWEYLMEKQDNFCLGLDNQLMHWPRGKVLGGTSVINYMIHVRGNKEDYDRWEALGNSKWGYRDVLSYFLKSEDATLERGDYGFHNKSGLLNVEDITHRTKSVNAFIKACQQVGYPYVDYNGQDQLGVSYVQATTRQGRRCSAEKAFIQPVKHRPNLDIQLNSRVTKVLVDPVSKTAYGVEYVKNGAKIVIQAKREVVLSAGAFHSPQLLMLSGIGPEDHLTELEIPLIINLPVGKKLYDHLTFLGLVFTANKPIVVNFLEAVSLKSITDYLFLNKGTLTSLGGVEALAYFKTNVTNYPGTYPDMELIFIGGGLQTDYGLFYKTMFRVSQKVYNAIWRNLENKYAFAIFPMLLHPESYGYLKLKSKNPFDAPLLYGNYFSDPDNYDLKAFIAAVRECQRIVAAPAFREYGVEQVKTPVPGCEQHPFDSDSYWECALRHISATLHHQTTTCKMGPVTDSEAVVDDKLRVHGIQRLRVVDTSVIPVTLSAHINGPAYMIGEKGADLILEDYSTSDG